MIPETGEVLAIVPARGGSKSIPRKNLRLLAGVPLLAWSVAAALSSRRVGRVIVSTDDEEMREAAVAAGAEAPFLRPRALAEDETPDLPVFVHALEWLEREEGYRPEIVVQLRPTSPLRPPHLVDAAVDALASRPGAHSARTVCPPAQNPYKMWRERGGWMRPLLGDAGPEAYNRPRQILPQTLWQTGHVDAIHRDTILRRRSMTGTRVVPVLVEPSYAIDIDTFDQWAAAEWLLASGRLEVVSPSRSTVATTG
ncbi:MAG TPA: acylneuraminate cytidylyltransferase family protein [Vicinamibacteria bacterium]|nr:acylneuraminate cytidylyltransferase family protein [Vicinamibacteria bacterium]